MAVDGRVRLAGRVPPCQLRMIALGCSLVAAALPAGAASQRPDLAVTAGRITTIASGVRQRNSYLSADCWLLDEDSPLRGQLAIASARVAYQRYQAKFTGPAWDRLRELGARPQRPLWASTGTKNPGYSDIRYVSELIGPGVINTMPEQTLRAFGDHGTVARTLDADPDEAERTLADAAAVGIDLTTVTAQLEREGVRSFCDSYHQLLDCIERKLATGAAR